MNNVLKGNRYRLLQNLQYLQEQDKNNEFNLKKYVEAKAKIAGKENFEFNGKTIPVSIKTTEEARAIISAADANSDKQISETTIKFTRKKLRKLIIESLKELM